MGTASSPGEGNVHELARENGRLKDELQLAKDKVDSLQRELQAFVYAAGHDLKQSLRSIGAYSQLLARGGANDESATAYANFILDGVKSANTLIEQLVSLSRAGSSQSRSNINLSSCVHTALYKLSDLVKEKNAKVTVDDLPQVSVNQADFDQVFEKLLDNALKYSGADAPVIEVSAEEGEDGHVISVCDHGPGVPEQFHKDIFQPFKRLHSKEIPGAGVGLAFARKIVDAHDGWLWVESNGKDGAVFKIKLPY